MKRAGRWLKSACVVLMAVALVVTPLDFSPQSAIAQSSGGSVRLFFIRDGRIAAARRAQTPPDISIQDAAMLELLKGPRPDERAAGLSTAFNEFVDLQVDVEHDEVERIATVNFGHEFAELTQADMILAMAQSVYTLTQFNDVNGVEFQVDAVEIPALDGAGNTIDGAAKRADYEAVTPAIFVESPEVLTSVRSAIRVRGTANTFEAVFSYALYDADNVELASGFITATSGTGTRGRFAEEIEYELAKTGTGTLIVYEESAKDGSWRNVVAIPVTLRASTPVATATPTSTATAAATSTSTPVPIASQTATTTIPPTIVPLPTNTPRPQNTPASPATPSPTRAPELTSTPAATATPMPTRAPELTSTPEPTATPQPTNTPEQTSTPQPTNTPEPTATPQPTNTPEQTSTPQPTNTPEPTSTPQPTNTPEPTATATATATPIPTVTLTILVNDCPPGMTIETLNPNQCTTVSSGFDFRLTSRQHSIDLRLADADRAGLGYRWRDLPHGTYLLEQVRLPDGSLTFFIPRSVSVEGAAGSGYSISLDKVSGNLEVTIFILNRWIEIAPF